MKNYRCDLIVRANGETTSKWMIFNSKIEAVINEWEYRMRGYEIVKFVETEW